MRRTTLAAVAAVAALSLATAGCSTNDDSSAEETTASSATTASDATQAADEDTSGAGIDQSEFPVTTTDWVGHSETFTEKPERVAILSGTPLNVWYDTGGEAVATSMLSDNILLAEDYADEIRTIEQLGPPFAIDAEKLAALNPDLVITLSGPQGQIATQLQGMGIATITAQINSFDELTTAYTMFGALNGEPEAAEERIAEISEEIDAVTDQWPSDEETSTAILHVTGDGVSAKLDDSIAGDVSTRLGLRNVFSGTTGATGATETIPLDIEALVKEQPEYILVTSMTGSNEEARETLQAEFDSNPAWQSVDAVREDRVVFLPQQYFLYNAGPNYADAVEYLAASIHPDIYGDPVEP